MKGRQIEHRGVVERVMPHGVSVAIVQETACAACAAAQLCHSSEKKEKRMEIAVADGSRYRVGQEVTVVGELGLGLRAVLWAYGVPLVVLVAVMMLAYAMTQSEGLSAVAALLSLIPYYIILYILRGRLGRRFAFRVIED